MHPCHIALRIGKCKLFSAHIPCCRKSKMSLNEGALEQFTKTLARLFAGHNSQ